MASRRQFDPTQHIGVNAIEEVVLGWSWIWRDQPNCDFGIDAHIEIVGKDGKPTGQLIAVQVKTGASYFTSSKGTAIPLYINDDHMSYWTEHSLPVIIIIYEPKSQLMLWEWANINTCRQTTKGWAIDIPRANVFSKTAQQELPNKGYSSDEFKVRQRFILDRKLMEELNNKEDIYISIEAYINKSLKYRNGLQIRFEEPYKAKADHELPFSATWNYTIDDIMYHYFPWLEHEAYGEPESIAEEWEKTTLKVSLNRAAKAFLFLEDFYENTLDPAEAEYLASEREARQAEYEEYLSDIQVE